MKVRLIQVDTKDAKFIQPYIGDEMTTFQNVLKLVANDEKTFVIIAENPEKKGVFRCIVTSYGKEKVLLRNADRLIQAKNAEEASEVLKEISAKMREFIAEQKANQKQEVMEVEIELSLFGELEKAEPEKEPETEPEKKPEPETEKKPGKKS